MRPILISGGRVIDPEDSPKYLNSPETPLHNKGRTLYGLNLTKGEIRKRGFVIIVEGYFDFAQVFQAGGLPVVATCGTALTVPQAQHLRRFASKSVLCCGSFFASRVARLSLTVSMTWKGRLTRGTSLSVPSSLYLPGQTSSVLVMSIFAMRVSPLVLPIRNRPRQRRASRDRR